MARTFNPYTQTLIKLNNIKKQLNECLKTGNYDLAEPGIATLRDYRDCYFCQAYRVQMEGHAKGVCDSCTVHKIGEEIAGRKIAYNGCYQTTYYRELVRLAWWFVHDKSKESAEALIKAIDGTINHIIQYKTRLDKEIPING